ncbi:hypothetical protein [Streptomyces sp. NRRL S-37]|uniref:hypothetical protein n=1 Tax=Streptomyces sp. NRRL S-37 TaxID=1463903 RepID=UPI000A7A77C8|nr:hypothetical protein [Streptomyces sp. NRRL S-37]
MSDHSLSPTWLASWASRVSEALEAMTDEFERRHGFPPGANEVRLADYADQAAARTLAQAGIVPADLVTFYDNIGDVTWADVGNGYFVDPAGDVLLRFKQYGAVDVGADKAGGLIIGSNGGGLSYVAGPGGVVHRTRTASTVPDRVRCAVSHNGLVVARDEEQGRGDDAVAGALGADFKLEAVAGDVAAGTKPQAGVVLDRVGFHFLRELRRYTADEPDSLAAHLRAESPVDAYVGQFSARVEVALHRPLTQVSCWDGRSG